CQLKATSVNSKPLHKTRRRDLGDEGPAPRPSITKYLHGARALGTPADVNTDGQTLLSGYAERRRTRRQ
ncbi:MAG TPA: hypothetical protein VKK06_21625, partial [Terriglobia bacterium]|nr:hypothetical protein [Terriglobia bacterium]